MSAFFITLLFAISCKSPADNIKQAYFDNVFNKLQASYDRKFYFNEEDIAFLDSSFTAMQGADIGDIARKHLIRMRYYRNKDRNDSAFLHTDSSINLLQNHPGNEKNARLYVYALLNKGDIYFNVKSYDEAIRNYTLAKLFLSANLKDSTSFYGNSIRMANILYAQQKCLLAAEFFRMKYLLAVCEKDPYTIFLVRQENMDNIGICYAKAGLTDSANYYYNATLDYINQNEKRFPSARHHDFEFQKSVVWFNQAEILYQQKDTAGAEKLYLKSIEGSKTIKDTGFIIPLHLSLAELYIDSKQPEKAADILQDVSLSIGSSEISRPAGNYYKLLSDYFLKTNQPFSANSSLLHAYNIRYSLEKRDRQFNATDVRREFENREEKAINQTLRKDNEIKTIYLLMAVIVAVMALVIIAMVWYNLKRKSDYVKKLTALNIKIGMKNDDLQKTLNSLEQSHAENNRIMRLVAHDLKNPISALRSLVYSLLKKEQTSPNKESLELIQETCVESITLIKDLLDNKRSLSDISKELVDIGRLIEQCTELFQFKAGEKNQHLKLQIDHPVMMLNRQKIWRVISNIVNNAIKFSPANADIMICLERVGDNVLLSVHDNDIGMPDDMKDKIFTIDPEKAREGTAGEKSYGLGLSISRKIIEEHEDKL